MTFDSKKQVEIGILEVRRHIPVLHTYMKICKTKNTKVTVFTTKELLARLNKYEFEKEKFNFVIKKERESISKFLKRVEKICNKKIDILIVNTIHETIFDLIGYLSFNPKCKKILVVHHINAWLKPHLVFKPFNLVITLDSNISVALIKFILPKFDAISVIYKPMKDYILSNFDFNKEIFILPTSIFEKFDDKKEKKNDKLRVVIPGLLQEHRKDFTLVFPALEKLFNQYGEKIVLYVAGMPVGSFGRIINEKFRKMEGKGYNITTFDDFIPDDEFDKILRNCDIILAPIRIKTRADCQIEEEYGKTVGSGVIYNAIKYAKPIIVPSDFNVLKEFESSTFFYSSSNDIENRLKEMLSNPKKTQILKNEALKNSENFSINNLQKYFEKNVLKWFNKN
jgi:hypothetical protein